MKQLYHLDTLLLRIWLQNTFHLILGSYINIYMYTNIYINIWTHTHTHTHIYIYIYIQFQVESYQKLKKMVLDAVLFNIQHYNVRSKLKRGQSRESSSEGVVGNEKGVFGSPLSTVTNFICFYLYIYICVCVCVCVSWKYRFVVNLIVRCLVYLTFHIFLSCIYIYILYYNNDNEWIYIRYMYIFNQWKIYISDIYICLLSFLYNSSILLYCTWFNS